MFLGVDGGGTKTAFCLIDDDGAIVASARTASIYYLMSGIDIVEPVLARGVAEVCASARIEPADITYSFFGIPCYGEVLADVPKLDALPQAVLGTDRYRCGNDMICGWAGSLGAADGINVVAGTGSIAYGENGDRKSRAGGWGEIFGDEGSAHWVAIRGLNAFSKMGDGRLPRGPLADVLRARLDLTDDLEIVDVVLNRWQGDRAKIAALSTAVSEAADAGDTASADILREAGRELAAMVHAEARVLGFDSPPPIPVSWSGGMFTSPLLLDSFRQSLDGRYDLREPLFPPDHGAALYAARLANGPRP
ncbi:N-acetylglucosamine kinase [Paractinoplanes abujensis]|uniref:N-acetylglucosamine kinase-like BadF-type ATPase n=1 Tax=Paractinoplanes abujensis TaxID=882441 RepID=A0A7W7CRD0_9ACTN|nr:BadF/BadG/BcrA/BcrD ATPase family protein [Actinoplanes abujensis]MBB4693004.1 N-acetylglucosamine kinase-like BadF-type ATPase [Actinoplanes abujensis]GID22492.1 N-acetylglucosamine kinase [Actinoplanes abujensis]